MSSSTKYTKVNMELRRVEVLKLLAKGHSQADIAKKLNVSTALISLDVQFLKEQAQEKLRTHIQEQIPFEYQRGRVAWNDLIKKTNEILDNTSDDPKMQLQVINTLANLWAGNMSLTTDGSTIEQAYKKVQTLLEIHERRSDEAVFSEADLKEEDTNPDREPVNTQTKITTIDDQDTTPEPQEEEETEEK